MTRNLRQEAIEFSRLTGESPFLRKQRLRDLRKRSARKIEKLVLAKQRQKRARAGRRIAMQLPTEIKQKIKDML